jgi:pyruvate/2-oxoglutarate dehydrogenase complex dihydrolipoamide dehydrogenase (E3) component
MAAVLRTRTISEPRGFIKMLIDAHSDLILGLTAFGAESSELLAAVQTAMLGGLPYTILRDGIAEGLAFLLANVSAGVSQGSAA